MKFFRRIGIMALLLCALGACDEPLDPTVARDDSAGIVGLSSAIARMGLGIDPREARRAAEIAYAYSERLTVAYEITDPPLVHNAKVNRGEKQRGLCWHWAEDMEARLSKERFRTIEIKRAIANAFNPFLIDHSTVILTARDDPIIQGVVVDPWRYGGALFWSPTVKDNRYHWVPREEVFAKKRGYRAEIEALEKAR